MNLSSVPWGRTAHAVVTLGLGVVLLLCLAIWPETSWAKSRTMRCGTDLVGKGSYQEEILARCGRPHSVHGNYWLYRKDKVVYRFAFNSEGRVLNVKSELRF